VKEIGSAEWVKEIAPYGSENVEEGMDSCKLFEPWPIPDAAYDLKVGNCL
jgi:hypothetical protein